MANGNPFAAKGNAFGRQQGNLFDPTRTPIQALNYNDALKKMVQPQVGRPNDIMNQVPGRYIENQPQLGRLATGYEDMAKQAEGEMLMPAATPEATPALAAPQQGALVAPPLTAESIWGEVQKQSPGYNENYGLSTVDKTYTPSISELQQSQGEDWWKYATQNEGAWSGNPQVTKASDPLKAILAPYMIREGSPWVRDTIPQQIVDLAQQAGMPLEKWDASQEENWRNAMQDARSGSWTTRDLAPGIAKAIGALITAAASYGVGGGLLGPAAAGGLGLTSATTGGAVGTGVGTLLNTAAQAYGGGASPKDALLKGGIAGLISGGSAGLLPQIIPGLGGGGESVVNGGLGELTQPGYSPGVLGGEVGTEQGLLSAMEPTFTGESLEAARGAGYSGAGLAGKVPYAAMSTPGDTFTAQVGKLMEAGYTPKQISKMGDVFNLTPESMAGMSPGGQSTATQAPSTPISTMQTVKQLYNLYKMLNSSRVPESQYQPGTSGNYYDQGGTVMPSSTTDVSSPLEGGYTYDQMKQEPAAEEGLYATAAEKKKAIKAYKEKASQLRSVRRAQ